MALSKAEFMDDELDKPETCDLSSNVAIAATNTIRKYSAE
jgi:hypothetical protein